MDTVTVHTDTPYDIHIGPGLLGDAGARVRALFPRARTVAVVADDTVNALYGGAVAASLEAAGLAAPRFVFPHGEEAKCPERLLEIYTFLSENAVTRSDALVALGGGVAGDLGGFAAATWLRGVPLVQMPTTFLAAIDSSVGGKTAINIPAGKNLAGAFWQPRLVLCDTAAFSTLTPEIFADGAAEAIKYGALFDEDLLALACRARIGERLGEVVRRCVDLKRLVVEEDERDTGRRQLLNFGHTLGHAVERETRFAVSHGRAVGIGMVELTRRTERAGITAPGTARRIAEALASYGSPTRFDGDIRSLIPALLGDKKRHGDTLSFVVLERIGVPRLHNVPISQVESFLCDSSIMEV